MFFNAWIFYLSPGIGIAMVAVSIFVSLYYNILIAYIIYFFLASMTDVLPWSDCGNYWNTVRCMTANEVRNETYKAWHLERKWMRRGGGADRGRGIQKWFTMAILWYILEYRQVYDRQ